MRTLFTVGGTKDVERQRAMRNLLSRARNLEFYLQLHIIFQCAKIFLITGYDNEFDRQHLQLGI